MNRTCFRCGKPLAGQPLDYVMGKDTFTIELQPSKIIGKDGKPLEKKVSVQKTALICAGCHQPTDTVIWGVHKHTQTGGKHG